METGQGDKVTSWKVKCCMVAWVVKLQTSKGQFTYAARKMCLLPFKGNQNKVS